MRGTGRMRRVEHGTYTITPNGDSRSLCFLKALEGTDFPSAKGEEVRVERVEDGDETWVELYPATDE